MTTENTKSERKTKYIGFRIGFNDYLRIVELCGKLNTTITDFVLSAIYPILDKGMINPVSTPESNNILPAQKNNGTTLEAMLAEEKIIDEKIKNLTLN